MVGAVGFEPTTSWSRTKRATKLRYAPTQSLSSTCKYPVFHNVGENLYRLESSGAYYALIKKAGKQFRRSLKTKDPKLAGCRLSELKEKVGVLQITEDAHANFKTPSDRWFDSRKHKLGESMAEWYGYLIKNLAEFFGDASIRDITVQDCEHWAATRRKTAGTKAFVSELDTMNAVFQHAVRHGLILTTPTAHVERPTVRQPKILVPSLTDFRQIVAAIRESDGRPGSQQRATLEKLKTEKNPAPGDAVISITDARTCLETACRKPGFPKYSHHDFRHSFATTCIESGVDVPTVSRWLDTPMAVRWR
jgi:integrase